MGRDKASLPYLGRRLVDHVYGAAARASARAIVSGGAAGLPCAVDETPGRGPVEGAASAARALEREGALAEGGLLLVLPVDLPSVDAAMLSSLVRAARADDGRADAYRFRGHELPLVLRWSSRARDALDATAATENGGARSFRALARRLRTREVPLPPDGDRRLVNANTPETWRRLTGDTP
jgi:molybdopterin-guanine dinucleotide biosynthesis protein A